MSDKINEANKELAAALAWYQAMGVKTLVGEEALDFTALEPDAFSLKPTSQDRPGPRKVKEAEPAPTLASLNRHQGALVEEAGQLATKAQDLAALRESLAAFEGCSLKKSARNLVFADGNPAADLMMIGEAPGREEDLQGLPFIGRSGQLLDRMMGAIGLDRQSVYITNLLPWRPPGNRTPSPEEVAMLRPFILRHIALVAPKVILFLGAASAQALTGRKEGIMRMRGKWLTYSLDGQEIPALATFHPAFLLRQPLRKAESWRDLLLVKQKLGQAEVK